MNDFICCICTLSHLCIDSGQVGRRRGNADLFRWKGDLPLIPSLALGEVVIFTGYAFEWKMEQFKVLQYDILQCKLGVNDLDALYWFVDVVYEDRGFQTVYEEKQQ